MKESPAWLKMLVEVSAQESAMGTVRMCDAVLAGSAPGGNIKNGGKVRNEIRKGYLKQAGF